MAYSRSRSVALGALIVIAGFCSGCGSDSATQATSNHTSSTDSVPVRDNVLPNGDTPVQGAVAAGQVIPALPLTEAPASNGQEQPAESHPQLKRADIYNVSSDATADVAAAVARAKQENKRVLVMFGGNWCGWCYKLHDVFEKDREIAKSLQNEYERVMVDIGRFDKNMDLAASFGADLKAHGVPFLTVLDCDGHVLANQDTGELEDGPVHDTGKVRTFLTQWIAEPLDAEQVLAAAQVRAKEEGKLVFVHLGAPWCGWCHRLDHFLDENHALFERDYVLLKIDTDRMSKGKSVAEQLRGTLAGGIPWIAILDGSGTKLITSDGPEGNIGYPAEPKEIEHFISMLQSTAKNLTPGDISQVQTMLSEAAKKFSNH